MGDLQIMIWLSWLATFFAACITIDTLLVKPLSINPVQRLARIKLALRNAIGLIDHGNYSSFAILATYVVLLLFFITLTAVFDPNTTKIVLATVISNKFETLSFIAAGGLIALWSFRQTAFFIMLANRTTSLIGMIYLFISDLLLSIIIFALGFALVQAGWGYFNSSNQVFSTLVPYYEDCDDGDCVFVGSHFLNGGRFEPVFWNFTTKDTDGDISSWLEKDLLVSSVQKVALDSTDLELPEQVDQEFLGFWKVDFDLAPLRASYGDFFSKSVKLQIDEVWRYLKFDFKYYSMQPIAFTEVEALDEDIFARASRYFYENPRVIEALGEETLDRFKYLNRFGEFEDRLKADEEFVWPKDFPSEDFFQLYWHQSAIWYVIDAMTKTKHLEGFSERSLADFRKAFFEKNGSNVRFGETAIKNNFVPVTTIMLATIGYSSLFLLFLVSRFGIEGINFVSTKYSDFLSGFPITFSAALMLGLAYLFRLPLLI